MYLSFDRRKTRLETDFAYITSMQAPTKFIVYGYTMRETHRERGRVAGSNNIKADGNFNMVTFRKMEICFLFLRMKTTLPSK